MARPVRAKLLPCWNRNGDPSWVAVRRSRSLGPGRGRCSVWAALAVLVLALALGVGVLAVALVVLRDFAHGAAVIAVLASDGVRLGDRGDGLPVGVRRHNG